MNKGMLPKEYYRDQNGMHPIFVSPSDIDNLAIDIDNLAADIDDLAGVGRTTETVKGNADNIATKADDSAVVHKTGDETIAGVKIFSDRFIGAAPLMHIEDQKSSGTGGGTFTQGDWRTRDLNTEITNEITGASLASNQITLPAGTYEISANASTYGVSKNMSRLQNITDGTTALWGTSIRSLSSMNASSYSFILGRITIADSKVFEIQHRCESTRTTTGFGLAVGGAFAVDHETYTQIWIKKIG